MIFIDDEFNPEEAVVQRYKNDNSKDSGASVSLSHHTDDDDELLQEEGKHGSDDSDDGELEFASAGEDEEVNNEEEDSVSILLIITIFAFTLSIDDCGRRNLSKGTSQVQMEV